jgi:glycosyltransferase involved in cell wall biosynthesis
MTPPEPAPLRILHAPRNIAGQGSDIVAALRRLGHHAELWEDVPDVFGRPSDRVLALDRSDGRATWDVLRDVVDEFDIVHFHFGLTFVPRHGVLPPYWDLPLLRSLGLRVYFTFHGSDIRMGQIHGEINPWSHLFVGPSQPEDDRIAKSLQVMRTYADRLFVASVNNLAFVPDAVYLPRVIDLGGLPPVAPRARSVPVLVHAPTRRGTKGTDLLLSVLDQLRAEGLEFELRLLEGVSHAEVMRALADADVLLDNIVAGSYGIVSLEAMASGAVAVSAMSDAVVAAHPDAPVVRIDPDTAADVLRGVIPDVERRARLGALGRAFVERVHDADRVAEQLVEHYRSPRRPVRDRAMPDWMSMKPARQIETLEARIEALEVDLARARRNERQLRERLGLPVEQTPALARRFARRVVPARIRRRLARRF